MKKILLFLFLVVGIYAENSFNFYSGNMRTFKINSPYIGVIAKMQNDIETKTYKFGGKRYFEDINQKEAFFSFDKELDMEKNIEFGILGIENKKCGGEVYFGMLHIYSFNDYNFIVNYEHLKLSDVFQLEANTKIFLGRTPFYLNPHLYLIKTQEKNYESLNLKIGYIYKKSNFSISSFIGEHKFLVNNEKYSTNNFGFLHKYGIKIEYLYQLTLHLAIIANYSNDRIINDRINGNDNFQNSSFFINYRY